MKKKTIIHIVESLAVGGTERLLAGTVNELSDFNNIVVYLKEPSSLKDSFKNADIFFLNHRSPFDIIRTVLRIRNLVYKYKADIVHSHLFYSTLLARIACPKQIPFIFTVHSIFSKDAFEKNKLSKWAERLTYKKHQNAIFVSEVCRKDYQQSIGLRGKNWVLHNFVENNFLNGKPKNYHPQTALKLIAVGNLREQKNHIFLLRCFEKLKSYSITLDIYGHGPTEDVLKEYIKNRNLLNVKLMGAVNNISDLMENYDAFVLSSKHEGFGIAPIEAMGKGLPCILSDIEVFRNITENNALFFSPEKENDLISIILEIFNGKIQLENLSVKGMKISKKYSKDNYMSELNEIYSTIIKAQNIQN